MSVLRRISHVLSSAIRGRPRFTADGVLWVLAGGLVAVPIALHAGTQDSRAHDAPAQPDGYSAVESPNLPDRLTEITSDSAFSVVVERDVAEERHRRMIHIAERLVPTTERLNTILETGQGPQMTRGNWPTLLQEAQDAEAEHGQRWWWLKWDDAFLPISLGAPAVHHYVELFRSRSAAPNPFGPEDHGGHLRYSARVEATEAARINETPWVVVLDLTFNYWCGSRCALAFSHERRVHFDASGRPVRVEGDMVPSFAVS
jgi:hypothetical protein